MYRPSLATRPVGISRKRLTGLFVINPQNIPSEEQTQINPYTTNYSLANFFKTLRTNLTYMRFPRVLGNIF